VERGPAKFVENELSCISFSPFYVMFTGPLVRILWILETQFLAFMDTFSVKTEKIYRVFQKNVYKNCAKVMLIKLIL